MPARAMSGPARPTERSPGVSAPVYLHRDDVLPGVVSTAVGYATTDEQERIHRGLPSPYLTVIFSLDGPIVCADRPESLGTKDEDRTAIIAGRLHTTPAFIAMPRQQAGIQLAVHPLAARTLLGAASAELSFPVTDGRDLLGPEAERLRMRLIETPDWDRRFELLAHYLRRRVDSARPSAAVRPELAEAWRWLSRHRGTGSIDALARHVLLSRRQLGALFDRELGMSPKAASRLIRFQRAMRAIAGSVAVGQEPQLADAAARCGYYDQSHLDRDFRGYVGLSPTAWLGEERRNIQAGGHRNGEA